MKTQSKQQDCESELTRLRAKVAALEADCERLRAAPERRFQELYEHTEHLAHLGHFEWDEVENRCVYCSEELARLLGLSTTESLKQLSKTEGVLDIVHPDDRDRFRAAVAALETENKGFDLEWRVVRPDGEVRELREVLEPILDADGKRVRSAGYVQDITETKQRERALRKSQDLFERTERLAKLGHFEWDEVADKCTYCSKALAELQGLSVDDYVAQFSNTEAGVRAVHPDDRGRHQRAVAALQAEGRGFDIEYRTLRSNGEYLEVREVLEPVFDETGTLVRSVGYLQDISERKRSERALSQSEQRFKDFADVSSHWLWEMSPDLRFTYISDGITRVTGEDPADFIGKTRREIAGEIPTDSEALEANLAQMDRHEPFKDFIFERPTTTGGRVCLSLSGKPVYDPDGQFQCYRGTAKDVTEQIRMLEALQKTDALFKRSERLAKVGHWEWDELEDRCSYCSEELARLHGVSVDEYLEQETSFEADLEWAQPEDRERYDKVVNEAAEQGTGYEIEFKMLAKNGSTLHVREVVEAVLDEKGSLVKSIGSLQDITERKKTEEALRQSEELLSGAFNSGLVGMAILSPSGHFEEVNNAYCDFLGYTAEELIGQHFEKIIHQDDLDGVTQRLQPLLAGEVEAYQHERRYRHKDRRTVWGLAALSALHLRDGSPGGFIVQVLDITERKRTELELQESEARLRGIMDHAPMEIYLKDAEGRFVEINRHYEEKWGIKNEEIRGKLPDDVYCRTHAKVSRAHDLAVLESGQVIEREDDARLDGGLHYLHMIKYPIRDAAGHVEGLGGFAIDLTQRKRAEEALRQSETLLTQAAQMANLGHWVWDEQADRCVYCSEGLARMNGMTAQEYLEKLGTMEALLGDIHPDDRERYERTIAEAFKDKKPYDIAYRDIRGGGDYRYLRERAEPVFDDNGVLVRTIGILQDITKDNEAEAALRKSEETLRDTVTLMESGATLTNVGYWIWDEVAEVYTYSSESHASLHGLSVDEFKERYPALEDILNALHPDDRERWEQATSQAFKNREAWQVDFRRMMPSGEYRHLRQRGEPIFDEQGRVVRTIGSTQDITRDKEAEAALRKSEEALNRAQRVAKIGHWERSVETSAHQSVSSEYARIHGVSQDQAKDPLQFETEQAIHRDDRDRVIETIERANEEGLDYEIDYRIVRPDGEIRHVQEIAEAVFDEAGRVTAHTGTLQDITERKRAELELRESRETLQALIDHLPQFCNLRDPQGRYIYVNKCFQEWTGAPAAQILGKTVCDFYAPDQSAEFEARDKEVLSKRRVLSDEIDIHYPDGQTRSVARTRFPVISSTGEILGLGTLNEDISERKRAEAELRRSEEKFRALFEQSPIGIWEEDYSGVKNIVDRLQGQGVRDLRAHFETHPEDLLEAIGAINNIDVNAAGLALYGAKTREDYLAFTSSPEKWAEGDWHGYYKEEIASFAEGLRTFEAESRDVKCDGTLFEIQCVSHLEKTYEDSWSRVISTQIDVTERTQMLDQLRQSETALIQASEIAKLGQWIWDDETDTCLYCSEGLARMEGVTVAEYLENYATHAAALADVHPDDRERYDKVVTEASRTREPYELEFKELGPDGKYRYLRERGEPIPYEPGKRTRTIGYIQDITKVKERENALRESEARFQAFMENSPFEFYIKDREGHHIVSGGAPITGRGKCIEGKTSREVYPEIVADQLMAHDKAVFETSQASTRDIEREIDGVLRVSRVIKFPLRNERGETTLLGGISIDITEQKWAEEALHQSEEKYRDLIEGSIQGIYIADLWNPLFANQACAEIFGFDSIEEFVSQESIVPLIAPHERKHLTDYGTARMRGEEAPRRHVAQYQRKDGSKVWLESVNRLVEWEGRPAIQATIIDITERKNAEDALRESEARLRGIMDHAPVEIYLKDAEGRYEEINRHYENLWGVKNENVRGKLPGDVHHEEQFAAASRAHDLAVLESGQVIEQEDDALLDGDRHSLHMTKFPIRDGSGNVVGLGAIAIDTTERKRAEEYLKQAHDELELKVKERTAELEDMNLALQKEIIERKRAGDALRASQVRLNDAIESISEGFVLFDAEERLVLCNSRYREMFPEIADIVVPGTGLEDLLRAAAEHGQMARAVGSAEDWIRKRLHEYRTAQENVEQRLADGRWILTSERKTAEGGIVGIRTDITERKQAELEAQTSRARFAGILDLAAEAVISVDREERVQLFNRAAEAMFGYSSEEIVGRPLDLLVPERHRKAHHKHVTGFLASSDINRAMNRRGEVTGLHKNSREFPIEASVSKLELDGEVILTVMINDITERNVAEEALRQSEDRLRQATELAELGYWIWDAIEDRCLYCSEENARIHGTTVKDYIERATGLDGALPFTHPEDLDLYRAAFRRMREQGAAIDIEYRVRTVGGETRYVREIIKPLVDDKGRITRELGTIQDITERKHAEEARHKQEARLRQAYEIAKLGYWYLDQECDHLSLSPELAALLHVPHDEVTEITFEDYLERFVHPSDRERVRIDSTLPEMEGARFETEYRLVPEDGETRWVHEVGEAVLDETGQYIAETGTIQDITERKRVEEAIKEREAQLRHAQTMAKLGTFVWDDVKNCSAYCSEELAGLLGMSVEEYTDRANQALILNAVHPDDRDHYQEVLAAADNAIEPYDVEYRVQDAAGNFRYWREMGEPESDGNGRLVRTFGTVQDITDMKLAEEDLRESERRYREFFDDAPGSLWVEDWSDIKQMVDRWAEEGVEDWREYFAKNRDRLIEAYDTARILDVSHASLEMFGAASKQALLDVARGALAVPDELDAFAEILLALIEGQPSGVTESLDRRVDGTEIVLRTRYVMPLRYRHDWSRLIYTLEDVTERKQAEDAIRTRDAWLRAIFENAPLEIVLKDTEGRIMAISRNVGKEIGLELDDFIGRKTSDFLPEHIAASYMALDRKVLETGHPLQQEVVEESNGSIKHCLSAKFPLKDDRNRIIGVCSLTTDITERKQAEIALRQSEDRLRQATELAGLGYWIWDSIEDRCIFCSEETARIHGTTVEDYLARAAAIDEVWSFTHPDDRDAFQAAIGKLRSQGTGFDTEYRVVTRDGETRYVQENVKPVFDDDGRVIREYGTIQDITGRKQAEEAVRTRDAWLRAILENAPLQIVLKDSEGRVMAISKNHLDDRDVNPEEFLGRTTADTLPPDIAQVYMALDRKVLETGQPVQREVVEKSNGSVRHCLSSKFPLTDDRDRIIGVCSLTTDITDMKMAEDQLRQAQKMEAIGKLAGGVAHDFNNSLFVIQSNLTLLEHRLELDQNSRQPVDAIRQAAELAAELAGGMLAFSRQQPLSPIAVDLPKRIAGMVKSLLGTLAANIEIETSFVGGIRTVLIDPRQLESAVLNLAVNARDAMPEGGTLKIVARNLDRSQQDAEVAGVLPDGDFIKLSVSDSGSGMPADVVDRAFDPFFTTKPTGSGTGLGLSMVYGFIKQTGGHIEIESQLGEGTTINMYLPCAERDVSEIADESEQVSPVAGGSETILVTEDSKAVRQAAVTLLHELGYHTIEAKDAAQALELLEHKPSIDLLFSDVVLPGAMTGYELAVKARESHPDLKVVFCSGFTPSPGSPLDIRDRKDPLLHKPYKPDELGRTIRAVLDAPRDD